MRKSVFWALPILLVLCAGAVGGQKEQSWAINATIIEACSCPMFCQCYFNTKPAAHHGHGGMAEHYCRANFAYKVNKGHYGNVKLDGVKFWLAGDLGGDFGGGQAEWIEATFEPSVRRNCRLECFKRSR
jgi:hypothetical protein